MTMKPMHVHTALSTRRRVLLATGIALFTLSGSAAAQTPIDLDTAPSDIDSLRGIRAFAGYAGWTAGQLEAELLDDAWLVVNARPDDILHPDPPVLWWEVVGRQSGDTAKLRHYPEEPWLN